MKYKTGDKVTVYRLKGNLDSKHMIGKTYTVQFYQGDCYALVESNRTVSEEEVAPPPTKLEQALQ